MKYLVALLLILCCGAAAAAQPRPSAAGAARTALRKAGADWRVEEPGGYFSLRLAEAQIYPGKDARSAAAAFLRAFGPAVGLDSLPDARLTSVRTGVGGGQYLRFAQQYLGVPVLGGSFTVTTTASGEVTGMNGSLLPKTFFAPAAAQKGLPLLRDADETKAELGTAQKHASPSPDADETKVALAQIAREVLLDRFPSAMQWDVTGGDYLWTSRHPWQPSADNPLYLTRVFDVTEPGGYRAERVCLDAATGRLVLRHQLHCELTRRLYHRNTNSANTIWREGDAFPGSLAPDDEEALTATAEFYYLMHRTFGRRSFDDNGGEMRIINNASLNNCPNANAAGNVIRMCAGVVGDDIVAHEWTHNYISSMNGLIYAFESGAINEAFADIFGEALDLLNDRGNDTNDDQPRSGCGETNMRWLIAEDATAIDTAIRDMWLPECKNDPATRDSPLFVCTDQDDDAGGVHANSGLVNRTFALLTDGGIVGNDTVRGIGLTKALHIFHHTNEHYLTQVTDFFALADMLILAAQDLRGVNLPALTLMDLPAMASDAIIRPDDILQLERAIRITQLRGNSSCRQAPTLAQNPPALCAGASIDAFGPLLVQNWEDSLKNWTTTEVPGVDTTWRAKPWRITGNLPDGRPGLGVFAPNPRGGDCNSVPDNGQVWLTSPAIFFPLEETEFVLSFDHYYTIQELYDGGVLFWSINGGNFRPIPNAAFLYNGYDGSILRTLRNRNPLEGAFAFYGNDQNSTTGTWGRSIVDLTALGVRPGDKLQLRWAMSYDGCDGRLGWFIDDIQVGFCGLTALPVSYTLLRAAPAKNHLRLDWQTATETQNLGFYVERRRADGTDFRELGFVAAGNGSYTYADYQVAPAVTYVYRLRQADTDGTVHYSELVSARLDGAERSLSVYPNPVTASFTILAAEEATEATLYDATGRLVMTFPLQVGQTQVVASPELKRGVYLLRVGQEVVRVMFFNK